MTARCLRGCPGVPAVVAAFVFVAACTAGANMTPSAMPRAAPTATVDLAPTPSPAFTVGATPTARGYHQLVSMGGDAGVLLLSGFTIEGTTVAEHGIPLEGTEHHARTPDAVWAFTSDTGWSYQAPDRIFATNQVDAAIDHPASGRVLMHLAAFGDPSARWLDPSGAVTSTADGAAHLRGANMAYDAGSDRFVVFGGQTDQTWAYDPAADTWTRMEPATRPMARNYGAMAYDPGTDRVILFGGGDASERAFGDTWAYDVDTDTWIELAPPSAPGGRFYTAMVYDPVRQWMILFGGVDAVAREPADETWTHDGAFDEWDHPLGDTWAYDPAANSWVDLAPAIAPSARGWHDMAYEAGSGLIVLFGGGPGRGSSRARPGSTTRPRTVGESGHRLDGEQPRSRPGHCQGAVASRSWEQLCAKRRRAMAR